MIRESLTSYRLQAGAAQGVRDSAGRSGLRQSKAAPRRLPARRFEDSVAISAEGLRLAEESAKASAPRPGASVPAASSASFLTTDPASSFSDPSPPSRDISLMQRFSRFVRSAFAEEPTPRGALIRTKA